MPNNSVGRLKNEHRTKDRLLLPCWQVAGTPLRLVDLYVLTLRYVAEDVGWVDDCRRFCECVAIILVGYIRGTKTWTVLRKFLHIDHVDRGTKCHSPAPIMSCACERFTW